MPPASAAREGPVLLGVAVSELEGLAAGLDHRQTGDGRGLRHRKGFRLFWTWMSRRKSGRLEVSPAIRALILNMAAANRLRAAPTLMASCSSLRFTSRNEPYRDPARKRRPPSQTWKAFLDNHLNQLASIDFFTVPTVTFRVLFVLVVLAHRRRRVIYFNVTEHPTAAWTAQQILEAFPENTAPRYLIRDRDQIYGEWFRNCLQDLGITEVLTAPQSPWQKG